MSGYNSRVFMAGVILFFACAWFISTVLSAGIVALFSHYAPAFYRRQGEGVWFWAALVSTVVSVGIVTWLGWHMMDRRFSFLLMGIYTFLAAVNEWYGEQTGGKDSVTAWGSLAGHGINVVVWGGIWYFSQPV